MMSSVPISQPLANQYLVADSTVAVIHLKHPAQRVVCLSASGLDVLLELGLEPAGGLSNGVARQPEFYGERSQQWIDVGSWLVPNFAAIRRAKPDLILGWQFPHRFYRWTLADIAPVYLMGGSGYEEAILRLLDMACLTGRMAAAEAAIATLDQQIETYRQRLQHQPHKTVLVMGGSMFNCWLNRYPVETHTGTLGSVLQQFTRFPWSKPAPERGEAGLTYLSLQNIAIVDPDVIFVQSYGPTATPLSKRLASHPTWQQLKAVKTQQVYEIEQFWHWGNGTRLIRLMLEQLLPVIYPSAFQNRQGCLKADSP
ncbi:MAG: ABC transporter substrate-binding protein [Cyanobacteria bacterium J06636_16]